MSAYLEKAPTAQLTRINAADRPFPVPLTRITSVPECAVSSLGFLRDQAPCCGVVGFCGLAEASGWVGRPPWSTQVPRLPNPMTTFLVTQRHRCHMPARDNSAPNAEYLVFS